MSSSAVETEPVATKAGSAETDLARRTMAKVSWRLVPFLVLLYLLNYLDRTNISFAKLEMLKDLSLDEKIYGTAAGIFFLGYFLFEVPSNLIMERVGARLWMARIMITWGLISAAMAFVLGEYSLYGMRFLLGAAEAGFFPGVLLYLTYWIPSEHRARVLSWFLTSTALAGVVGMPLAGLLMELDGMGGLQGWQWLFIIEGLPSVVFGILILFWLTDKPSQAAWLKDDERQWLCQRMDSEASQRVKHGHAGFAGAFVSTRVWHLCLTYFCIMFGFNCFVYWMPTVLSEATGLAKTQLGLLAAVPYGCAVAAMVIVGRHSDRTGERRWHVLVSALVGSLGLALCALTQGAAPKVIGLCIAAAGIWSTLGPFWAIPPAFLSGTAAAAGLALINSVGCLAGYLVNEIVGRFQHANNLRGGLLLAAGVLVVAGTLAFLARVPAETKRGG